MAERAQVGAQQQGQRQAQPQQQLLQAGHLRGMPQGLERLLLLVPLGQHQREGQGLCTMTLWEVAAMKRRAGQEVTRLLCCPQAL